MIALPPRSRKMRTHETGLYSIANAIASVGAGNPRSSAARSSRVSAALRYIERLHS
jgi:hypothetical protein